MTTFLPSPALDRDISKFMSYILRHAPEQAGLVLDESGWADFTTLCGVLATRFGATATDIRRVVDENPKKRFALQRDRIRAVQGHSVEIDLGLPEASPPEFLFHGTKRAFLPAILTEGLTKQSRHHVHLSPDIETARVVARRRKGENAILSIEAGTMAQQGSIFYLSDNGVWLTDHVPPRFITEMKKGADA